MKYLLMLLMMVLCGCGESEAPKVKTFQNENPLIESGKWSKLHEAVNSLDLETVKALIEKKVDVNVVSVEESLRQMSPLHLAVQKGSLEICARLLDAGADVNQVTTTGMTPLHFAIDLRNGALVQLFVKRGANLEAESWFVHKPVEYARKKGFDDLIPLLQPEP